MKLSGNLLTNAAARAAKKSSITSFMRIVAVMLLLASALSVHAQLAEGYYYIQWGRNNSYYLAVSGNRYNNDNNTPYLNTRNQGLANDLWQLVSTGTANQFYIIHVSDGKYVVANKTGQEAQAVHLETTTSPGNNAKFTISGNTDATIIPNGSTYSLNSYNGAGGDIGLYNTNDNGSKWNFQSGYVFMNGDNFLGQTIDATTTFDPKSCIYYGRSGTKFVNENGYIIRYDGGLKFTQNAGDGNTNFDINKDNQLKQNGENRFLNLNKTTWRLSNNQNRATAYPVITTNVGINTSGMTAPEITCEGLNGSNGIKLSHTNVSGSYIPAHTTYSFNNRTYYYYNNTTYTSTDQFKVDATGATYAWSVTSGNASITNDGVLTLSNNSNQTITVRCRATTVQGQNIDETYTITTEAVDALNEQSYSDIKITPSLATIDLNGSQSFTASQSINRATRTRDAYVGITAGSNTYYKVGNTYQTNEPQVTETPGETINATGFNWTFDGGGYASLDQYYTTGTTPAIVTRTGQLTASNKTLELNVTGHYNGVDKTAKAVITIPFTLVDLTALNPGESITMGIGEKTTINGHYSYQPNWDSEGKPYINLTYSSADESIVTIDESGKITSVGPGTTTVRIQSKKMDGTNGVYCDVYVTVTMATPEISIDKNGYVTITHPTEGVSIFYSTDGSDPSTSYTGKFGPVANFATVRAKATYNSVSSSTVQKQFITSGVVGNTVYLYDYEDHSMTLYQSTDNLPTNYPSHLSSPNPKDVKITYNGGAVDGASSVGLSGLNDTEKAINQFVYYKTIERKAWQDSEGQILTGDYAYRVIPNPFSKRPKLNTTYYGFGGWKIISGGEYINGHNNNDVLGLEEKINFVNLPEYGAEIVFTATWVTATVVTNKTNGLSNTGTYETNFIVYTDNNEISLDALGNAATVSSYYPDGTPSGSARISDVSAPSKDTKIEFIGIGNAEASTSASGTFTASGDALLFVGRGCTGYVQNLYGSDGQMRARIESGYYDYCHPMQGGTASRNTNFAQIVFGNDYERATNDGLESNDQFEDNSERRKMRVKVFVGSNNAGSHATDNTDEFLDINIKSGYYGYSADYDKISSTDSKDGWGLGIGGNSDNAANYTAPDIDGTSRSYTSNQLKNDVPKKTMSFYVGRTRGGGKGGVNRLLIEGGELCSVNGGGYQNVSVIGYHLRIKGGWIKGAVYGTASSSDTQANLKLIITGGEVNGWVAGGCNGTDQQQGNAGCNNGNTYIYVGGTTDLRSHKQKADGTPIYNNAWGYIGSVEGGAIYGSGRGMDGSGSYDHMGSTIESYTVVADEAFVERNVCAGGYYGIAQQGYIFITGGTIGGSVYGGAWGPVSNTTTWCGQNTYIDMSGGLVKGGIYGGNYGGKNAAAAIQKNATVNIYGGQVGTDATHTANVFGGGEGNSTNINQNVTVTIGKSNEEGPIIFGDVYGGSAKGKVNGTAATTTYKTDVTLYSGTINGSLYGGGLGDNSNAADVYGPVAVKVYGGSVKKTDATGANGSGGVYGANNINGAPQRSVTVDIYGTDPAPDEDEYALFSVFGGGNNANYTYGNGYPKVTVHNCDNSIEYVYGGGNAAAVAATDVTIYGGNKIGNVFGGGNGQVKAANVTGNTSVKIYGGTIGDVYGGSNTNGTIGGTISVNVDAQAETGHDACPIDIDNVYGGGNKAPSNAGNITIGCAEHIGAVYGGANQADITGDIALNITAGHIDNVFGGNNTSGTIDGTITVTVNDSDKSCGMVVGNVYGGGNLASYTGSPTVNIIDARTTGSVFGGGLGTSAVVVGDPTVNIGSWTEGSVVIGGDVFGGGDLAAVEGSPTVTIRDCGTLIMGDIYGGGNAAPVYSTNTTFWGGQVNGNIFGGGNGADATKNAKGAQVGYKRDDTTLAPAGTGIGDAVTNVYGGTIGVWDTDGNCTAGGGVFGGSNTNGNITGKVKLTIDQRECTEPNAGDCTPIKQKEIYGSGNQAAYVGTGIEFNLGCVDGLDEIYGGAKAADMGTATNPANIHLIISSGHFKRVFGGNNLGGCINGSIKVSIDETGCNPVIIDELYCGGNQAAYSIYGYNEDKTPKTSGENPYDDPVVEVISCTHIGKVFGGGFGATAKMVGTTNVSIDEIPGKFCDDTRATPYVNTDKLGSIGEVFGGGNAADVVGNTNVKIGTKGQNAHIEKEGAEIDTDSKSSGVNITGNVYGGGNAADVTGKTNVVVGKAPTATP